MPCGPAGPPRTSEPEPTEFYWIVTFTWALVQQHWNPPPPSPDSSFDCTLTMYSPAALNVAVVLTISPCLVADKRVLANVTVPGPRNLWSDTDATVVEGFPPSPCGGLGSSTQTLKVTGWPTVPVNAAAVPTGGPVNFGPPSAKARTGGALPMPSSLNGVIG